MEMSKKETPGNFKELISAGLGGFINQFLEVPNRQYEKEEYQKRFLMGEFFEMASLGQGIPNK